MAVNIHIDQIDTQTIQATDAAGNVVTVTYDVPPVWTNSNPAAISNVVSTDGLSNVLTPLVLGGSSTISMVATIGGVQFSTSETLTVIAGTVAQVAIVDTFSAAPAKTTTP